jgi:hypothetical protein
MRELPGDAVRPVADLQRLGCFCLTALPSLPYRDFSRLGLC